MVTAVDTNVLVALWNPADALNFRAQSGLDIALNQGSLVIAAPVYAELLAEPQRTESFLDSFCAQTGVLVDWDLPEPVWRAAGRAYRHYAVRRKAHGTSSPRRILADFLIGAHALHHGMRLLTLDDHLYRAAFPRLHVLLI